MTFSSFDAYPGLVVWRSRDLVNWQPVGPALSRNVGSVWAPDLVKHGGRYYIYFPARTATYRSNYVVWADRIGGPWSEPIDLKLPLIDPGHAVGEDGKRYLFLSGGRYVPLADDGLATAGEVKHAYEGWKYPDDWIVESFSQEGPKILKHGEYFHMILAEGGTAGPPTGHMIVSARSRSIHGPVGELALQPDRADALRRGALVVEGARHARRGAGRPLVHRLPRVREGLPHARPADAPRARRVDGRRLGEARRARPGAADPQARRRSRAPRTASRSPATSRRAGWASSGASTTAARTTPRATGSRTARWC